MFMGLNPGSLPNLSQYDVYRRETYRDFGDSTGITSRSLIEGLFGIAPDALAGELTIRPGFPREWAHALIRTPDLSYAYKRTGDRESFTIEPRFAKPLALHLNLPVRAKKILSVEVNGKPAAWKNDDAAIGAPRVILEAPAAEKSEIVIQWSSPQAASAVNRHSGEIAGERAAQPGFERVTQGDFSWWRPLESTVRVEAEETPSSTFADYAVPADARFEPVELAPLFNDKLTQIFKNDYLAPRSPYVSLSMPKQGIGSWSAFNQTADIDDSGLRRLAAEGRGIFKLSSGLPLQISEQAGAKNTAFVSQWDNYPRALTAPLNGHARSITLLVAGSTTPMQSRIDNGEIVVAYTDGTFARLALRNPQTWWPIEQDYMIDDYAFRRTAPVPQRIELKTGRVYQPSGYAHPAGGAATLLNLPLDPAKELQSLTVRALSTEIVIGLLGATLVR
jgi:hypothetical protein